MNFSTRTLLTATRTGKSILAAITIIVLAIISTPAISQTTLLSPTGDGGFENGATLAANGWQAVNAPTDGWVAGSVAGASAGTNSAYITTNTATGTPWAYSQFSQICHLYRDITLPPGEAHVTLSFKWKAYGEGTTTSDWDNLKVFVAPTSVTPASGYTAISSTYQVSGPGATSGMYKFSPSSGTVYSSETIVSATLTAGTTYRLIFSWKSDGSTIGNPPASLDEISVVSRALVPADAAPIWITPDPLLVSATGMTIKWSDNSNNETGFRVYRSTDNVNFSQVGSNIASTSSATTGTEYTQAQTGLIPGTTYYFRIAAYFESESGFATGSQATNAAAVYRWNNPLGGPISTAANWEPSRTSPQVTDVLEFDGSPTDPDGAGPKVPTPGALTLTSVATATIGQIALINNANITLTSTGTALLTIGGGPGADLSVPFGSSLTLGGANSIGITYSSTAAPHSSAIDGTFSLTTTSTGTYNSTNAITTVNGLFIAGAGTNTITSPSNNNGYVINGEYRITSNSIGSGLRATWNSGSTLNITGLTSTTTSFSNVQAFNNVVWNNTGQTATLNLFGSNSNFAIRGILTVQSTGSGTLRLTTSATDTVNTINLTGGTLQMMNGTGNMYVGNISQSGGTLDFNASTSNGIVRLSGNFNSSAGTVTKSGANALHRLEFSGTSLQTITGLPSGLIQSYILNNPAGINAGGLTINQGASLTLQQGSLGIAATYAGTANTLIYNYATSTTATATEWPATGGPVSVTVNLTGTAPDNVLTVPFDRSLGATGVLTLSAGMFNNNGFTVTVPNTAAGSVTGASAAKYITGGLVRYLAASGTATFPVGKTTYNLFGLDSYTTAVAGTVGVRVEAFDGPTGGSAGTGVSALKDNKYWSASIVAGAPDFTSTRFALYATDAATGDMVVNSPTLTGAYTRVGGYPHGVTPGSNIISALPAATSISGFYLMASPAAPSVTNLTITPSTTQCTNVARTVTADVTISGEPLTSVDLKYKVNNGTEQTVAMTLTGGNTWTGIIPTVTPANGIVTWTVTAADAGGLSSTVAGTAYADEPYLNVPVNISASSVTSCAQAPVTLTAQVGFPSITLGAGALTSPASTGADGQISPLLHYYGSAKSQYLIRASELTAFGLSAGATFTSIGMDITSDDNITVQGLTISIAPTALTDQPATLITSGLTPVFAGSLDPSIGVNTITFNQGNFVWNGTSNLIIEFCWGNDNSGDGSDAYRVKYDNTSFVSNAFYRTDGSTGAESCASTTGTSTGTNSARPQFIFGVSNSVVVSSYSWSDGSVVVGTTNPLVVNPTTNTSYTLTTTFADGCTKSSAPIAITVNPLPETPLGAGSTQCGTGVPATFVVSDFQDPNVSTNDFRWYDAAVGGNLLQTGGSTYTGTISSTTVFYVSESNGTCESERVAITATVNPPDAVTAQVNDNTICLGESVNLSITQTGSNQTYSFNWNSAAGSGLTSPTPGASGNAALLVTPTAAGTYVYEVTAVDGSCTTESTVSVTVQALPYIMATTATPNVICAGESAQLNATAGGLGSGPVTFGTGTATTGQDDPNPFYHLYGGVKQQMIFTKAELNAAGLSAGNITSLAFELTALGTSTLNMSGFSISLGHTSQSAATTTLVTTGLTDVYTNASQSVSVGVNSYNFTTPFSWNDTDNLLVSISWSNNNSGSSVQTPTIRTYTTPFNATSYIWADNATPLALYNAAVEDDAGTLNTSGVIDARPITTLNGITVVDVSGTMDWVWNPGAQTGSTVSVSPAATQLYTVTATSQATGCQNTANVTVTVNQLPPAPTNNDGNHCGDMMPLASVSTNSGAVTPFFRWYDAPTGGNLVQSGTETTFQSPVSTTTVWYVSEVSEEGCEGPRVTLTESVVEADPITASVSDNNICVGEEITLDATQTGSNNFYDYSWTASPEAGSGLVNPGSGIPLSVTPTAAGTYVYEVTGNDLFAGCLATSTVTVTVNALPVITAANAVPVTQCAGADVVLSAASLNSAQGTSNFGTATTTSTSAGITPYYHFWGGVKSQFIIRASELTAAGYLPGNLTSIAFDISSVGTAVLNNFAVSIGHTAQDVATSSAAIGGLTTVYSNAAQTLTAGINTYTFQTPFVWNGTSNIVISTCYSNVNTGGTSSGVRYSAAGFVSSMAIYADEQTAATMCAILAPDGDEFFSTSSSSRPNIILGGLKGTNITSTYDWLWNPGAISGDTITVNPLVTTTYEVTAFNPVTGCTSLPTQVEVTVLPLPATPVASPSTQCGEGIPAASVSGGTGTFIWYDAATGGNVVQTGGATFTGSISTTTTWYVAEDDGSCESERVEVVATVNQPDAITATGPASICIGGDISLGVTQDGSNQTYTYTWTADPEAGSGITGSLSGGAQTITPTAAGTYTYRVAGFDAAGPCNVSDEITITVNALPTITEVTATPDAICNGNQSTLSASSLGAVNITGTVGAGASTSSSSATPFYGGWGGTKVSYIYTAAELSAAGIVKGYIKSVALDVSSSASTTFQGFAVGITSTSQTVFSTSEHLSTTNVYNGPLTNNGYQTTAGINTFEFSTPYYWDGTSSLVVSFCYSNNNSSNSASTVRTDTYTGVNKSVYTYGDNRTAAQVCGTLTGNVAGSGGTSTSTLRAKTIFRQENADITSTLNWAWNPGGLTGSIVNVTPSVTTTYSVIATDPGTGCSSLPSTVEVEVLPLAANATVSSPITCAGDAVTISANATGGEPLSYSWSDGTNVVANTASFVLSPTVTTTYTVTVQDVCLNSTTSSVTVTVNPLPTASIVETGPISLCAPATQVFTASTNTANPQYQWLNNGLEIPTATGSTYTVTESGVYSVRVTEGTSGCYATSGEIVVAINPLPPAITMDPVSPSICNGSSVALFASSGTAPFAIGTGTSTSTTVTPFKGFWGGSRMQLLFTAAELTAGGATAGSPISSLGMYVNSFTGPYTFKNFTVKIGHTSLTALTSTFETGLTTALGPVDYPLSGTTPFTETVNLSMPFVWNGTSNVVIEFCFWNEGLVGASANSAAVRYTSKTGGALYRSSDTDSEVCSSSSTGTTSALRTNITFGMGNYGAITWSPATGLSATSGNTVTANPTETTTYTATATTSAGCIVTQDVTVTVIPALVVSAEITGPTNPGAHVGSGSPVATYTITADNYSTITWAVPAGATNVSGQGTTSLSFNYPVGYTTGTVSVTVDGIAPCGSITRTLNIACDAPAAPVVSGPKNVCTYIGDGAEATYTIAPDATVSTYNWILPPGVNVVSGLGTGILTVTFDNTFGVAGSKQLRVTATNGCGTSALSIYYLVADKPASLGNITGPNDACGYVGTANEATYSVAPVDQAESYSWTLPAGVNLVGGAGTNSITVTFDNSFATSAITVNALNSCGTSNTRSITVTRSLPSTPAPITGSTNVCLFMPTSSNPSGVEATYSVPRVGVNTYNWTVPAEATITSQTQTATHDVITVSYSAAFMGGTISVTATNNCGTSPVARTLTLNRLNPGTPSAIDVVNTSSCPTRTYTYSLSAMPANTTSVEWTVPAGGTITGGAGTHSITVEYSGIAVAGDVTATAINGCGTSGTRKVAVKLPACPPAPKAPELPITGTQPTKPATKDQPQAELNVAMLEVTVFPNPSTHAFKLIARSEDKVSKLQVRLLDNLGREHKRFVMMPGETLTLGAELKAGAYFVEVLQGKAKVTKRILKY